MNYIRPKKIEQGMTIGIISISGCIRDPKTVEVGIENLHKLGFKTKVSKFLFDTNRYLAGSDECRLQELHDFFTDSEVDCILCSRGGYGALRIIDKIDYELIRKHPKAFCGYSDITAFSAMFLKHAGLITYSSPMLCGDFGNENNSEYTISNFLKAINHEFLEYELCGDYDKQTEGIAFGGNLTTIASLCGREFLPNEGFIFIVEDINEPAYKIDRCLEQLYGLEEFRENIRGIVAGDFTGTNREELSEILDEFSKKLQIPLWTGLKLGHDYEKVTFPIGNIGKIQGNKIFFK